MKKLVAALAAVAAVVCVPLAADGRPDPAVVRTDTGAVAGTVAADHRTFLGIPYAAAPEGALRWTAPRPRRPWQGVRPATEPGRGCWQPRDLPISWVDQGDDCLNLNVTTPTSTRGLPVVVYFHGGSFNYGSGANYDPTAMAARGDVVVVTVNYRLGAFGFLAHPALGADAGTLGIQDQQAALRWVRRNADAFGGNRDNVTIMGQSAGGYSVCAHLASPASAGLFQRAIIQSAACGGADGVRSMAQAEEQGATLAAAVGCGDVRTAADCLRRKSATELVTAAGSGHDDFRPVAGGRVLPMTPKQAIDTGRFNRVPVLRGGNHDEATGQLGGLELTPGGIPIADDAYPTKLEQHFGENAEAVLRQYPLTNHNTPSEALAAALTDRDWALPAWQTHRALARTVPTYAYEFAERETPWFPNLPKPSFPVGASHMLELPYLFEVGYLGPARQQQLADTMLAYWTNFAHTGNPNAADLPKWPPFPRGHHVQSLSAEAIQGTNFPADHHLTFWHTLPN